MHDKEGARPRLARLDAPGVFHHIIIRGIERPYWTNRFRAAWQKRPVVWLAGVRPVGKTTLARMLPEAVFMNCDLPSVARRLEDPELFFRAHPRDTVIVLDEVHRLPDPSRILKIAADAFPGLKDSRVRLLQ